MDAHDGETSSLLRGEQRWFEVPMALDRFFGARMISKNRYRIPQLKTELLRHGAYALDDRTVKSET